MADLRSLVESLGYADVRTLLNSGNVVFTTKDPPVRAAARIEASLEQKLGIFSRVTVLASAEVEQIANENSLASEVTGPSRLLVAVVNDPAHLVRLEPLVRHDWAPDALVIGSRAAYMWCAEGILSSKLPDSVGRLLGDGVTTRNWSTFTKLRDLLA